MSGQVDWSFATFASLLKRRKLGFASLTARRSTASDRELVR
jgi:hypothetical protein